MKTKRCGWWQGVTSLLMVAKVVTLHDKSDKGMRVVMRCDKLVDGGDGGD